MIHDSLPLVCMADSALNELSSKDVTKTGSCFTIITDNSVFLLNPSDIILQSPKGFLDWVNIRNPYFPPQLHSPGSYLRQLWWVIL